MSFRYFDHNCSAAMRKGNTTTCCQTSPQSLAPCPGDQLTVLSNLLGPLQPGPSHIPKSQPNSSSSLSSAPLLLPSIAAVAHRLSGALPSHHPHTLAALLAKGRLAEACTALRRLLHWLQNQAKRLEDGEEGDEEEALSASPRLSSPSAAAAAAALADPWALLEPLSKASASGGDGGSGGGGLEGSKGLAALLQMLQAPALAAAAPAALPPSETAYSSSGSLPALPRSVDPGMPMRPLSSLFSSSVGATAAGPTARAIPGSILNSLGTGGRIGSGSAATPAPHRPAQALDSGMLDMSAFGFGANNTQEDDDDDNALMPSSTHGVSLPGVSSPPPTKVPSRPAKAADPMSSGMLDMSTFGFGASDAVDDDDEVPPPPPPPPPPAPPPAAPPPPSTPGLDTGMLDMSAFGFGQEEEEAGEPQGEGEEAHAPPPLQAAPSASNGLLSMFGFGGSFRSQQHVPADPGRPPLHQASTSPPHDPPGEEASSLSRDPQKQQHPHPHGDVDSSTGGSNAQGGSHSSSSLVFPRVVEAPTDPGLPDLLLTREELLELHRLLNVEVGV